MTDEAERQHGTGTGTGANPAAGGRDGPEPGGGDHGGGHGGTTGRALPGWREATEAALYGPGGFYLRPEGPAGHFRTSVHASRLFAEAVARLLCLVDEELGRPAELAFVDMGAGQGELVDAVLAALPAEVASRTRGYAVERAGAHPANRAATGNANDAVAAGGQAASAPAAPAHGAGDVVWRTAPPQGVTGLLFANEWLDNVPLDVVETGPDGVPRRVLVHTDGSEVLGGPLGEGPDTRWLRRWWPGSARPGVRAEVGRPRDEAWADAVGALRAGYAVAADYGHLRASRPAHGTLTGFRAGREVAPVPDGSCDITAHVALDACAVAGAERVAHAVRTAEGEWTTEGDRTRDGEGTTFDEQITLGERTTLGQRTATVPPDPTVHRNGTAGSTPAGAGPRLVTQRAALHALGVTGQRPPLTLATTDPTAYVRALAAASEAAELTAPDGLGAFGWLMQPVGMPHPAGLPESSPHTAALLVDVADDEEQ